MPKWRQLDYFFLRYAPVAVRDEFVNFGLVMIESSVRGSGFADVRFTRDWRKLLRLDPQADLEMLQAFESDIRRRVVEARNCEAVMIALNESYSNLIQLSGVKGCLSENPSKELDVMASIYLEGPQVKAEQVLTARSRLVAQMQEAWDTAGVSKLVNPVAAAEFTKPGDPFKFDFGYRVDRQFKLFQAVSLHSSVDPAVMLASRYPGIADAMRSAKERWNPTLTAVVEDQVDRTKAQVVFAVDTMLEQGVIVRPVAEMPAIAAAARVELRA